MVQSRVREEPPARERQPGRIPRLPVKSRKCDFCKNEPIPVKPSHSDSYSLAKMFPAERNAGENKKQSWPADHADGHRWEARIQIHDLRPSASSARAFCALVGYVPFCNSGFGCASAAQRLCVSAWKVRFRRKQPRTDICKLNTYP